MLFFFCLFYITAVAGVRRCFFYIRNPKHEYIAKPLQRIIFIIPNTGFPSLMFSLLLLSLIILMQALLING